MAQGYCTAVHLDQLMFPVVCMLPGLHFLCEGLLSQIAQLWLLLVENHCSGFLQLPSNKRNHDILVNLV